MVLVKFTHRAETNLDGLVTPDDSAVFGGNYDESQFVRWSTGDMNYDGLFTPDDAAIFRGFYDETLPLFRGFRRSGCCLPISAWRRIQ